MIASLPLFGQGFLLTVALCLASLSGSLVLGTVVGLCRVSPVPALRWAGAAYVELLRNLPPLLVLIFVFFALPRWGIVLDPFPSAAIGLAVYGGAFFAEAVRGGILSISPAQVEAARALGLGYLRTIRHVVLPCAQIAALPALTTVAINLIKTTALAGAIGVVELMSQTKSIQASAFQIFEAYGMAAALYLALIGPLSLASAALERRQLRLLHG